MTNRRNPAPLAAAALVPIVVGGIGKIAESSRLPPEAYGRPPRKVKRRNPGTPDPEGVRSIASDTRVFDQGAFVRVTVSARGVHEWARRWPCFGSRRGLSFEFSKSNGDLVDIRGDTDMDGSGVSALADDAWEVARRRLKLPKENPARMTGGATYAELNNFLGKKGQRTTGHNTMAVRMPDGSIGIRLHRTYIVTFHSDGRMVLNSGGYRTVTTKARMNSYTLPNGWRVAQKRGEWSLWNWQTHGSLPYHDGITIATDGGCHHGVIRNEGSNYVCERCGAKFPTYEAAVAANNASYHGGARAVHGATQTVAANPVFDGDMDEDVQCPACGGPCAYLGGLGNRAHFRCVACGMQFSRKSVTSPNPKRSYAVDAWREYGPKRRRDNPGLMLVTGNPGPTQVAIEEAWCKFHQRDRFTGTVRKLGDIAGVPDKLFALGRFHAIDLGTGDCTMTGRGVWIACNPTDDALWIVSERDPMDASKIAGKSVHALTYDPMRSSGKDPAYYKHDFKSPLPTIAPVGNSKRCRAFLLDGGRYRVADWVYD